MNGKKHFGIEVKVYDATTNEQIGVFDSVAAASYEYEVSQETIRKSNKGIPISGNIYFRYGEANREYTNKAKQVIWYDAQTDAVLGKFNSSLEASQVTGIPVSTIRNNLYGRSKSVCKKKYYFRSPAIEYNPKNPEPYIQKGMRKDWLRKAVDVYSVETDEIIGTFDSVTEAAKFIGCKTSNVTANLKGNWKYKHQGTIYKKYYCKYHDE